jgi:two-component system, response regulator PdtaR
MLFGKRERLIRRIMIVEDEPLVAFDSEHALGEAGYEVVATVDSLAEAIAVLEREPLDLVLTDIGLAGEGDGHDVARAARGKGVPVLFVTARPSEEGRALGIACLAKPYSIAVLEKALRTVDGLLQGRKPRRLPRQLTVFDAAA